MIVFYLADVVLFQPGLFLYTGLDWQFIQIQGANLTILSALFLNYWLRNKRLQPWEWSIVGFIVLRMTTVMIWQLSLLRPEALIVVGSTSLQVLTLAGESGLGVITGQPATLLAILVGLRMVLQRRRGAEAEMEAL